VVQQVNAFKAGFSELLPIRNMEAFSLFELSSFFGYNNEDWSFESNL
jgi:hypothetical protein